LQDVPPGKYKVTITDGQGTASIGRVEVQDHPEEKLVCGDYHPPFDNFANPHHGVTVITPCAASETNIHPNAAVELKASMEIHLKPGFKTSKGSEFHAHVEPIEPCGPQAKMDWETEENEYDSNVPVQSEFRIQPNPFNNSVIIEYYISEPGNIILYVTDVAGKQVTRLLNNVHHDEGSYKLELKTSALPAGIYFCTLKRSAGSETKKIIKITQ